MGKISDDIREWCDDVDSGEEIRTTKELRALADRIDAEMLELPKDADGVPINEGDTVWINSGQIVRVARIAFKQDKTTLVCWTGNQYTDRLPGEVTRERPDSWERIACDIEKGKGTAFIEDSTLDEWADRVRKLAEKEDK